MHEFFIKYKFVFKYLFWAWLLLIFVVSSLPKIPNQIMEIQGVTYRLDYPKHFIAYFILAMFFILWRTDKDSKLKFSLLLVFIIGGFAISATDEMHQIWIPGRIFNSVDLINNCLGVIAGVLFTRYLIVPRLIKPRK